MHSVMSRPLVLLSSLLAFVALSISGCGSNTHPQAGSSEIKTVNLLANWGGGSPAQASAAACTTPLAEPVTFEQVKARIESCDLKSIEATLAALPESYRGSFTLMRKSKSAQEASDAFPRAILFGSDAKFLLTFNGDPAQKGYQEMEAIQFNDQTKQFDFHQLSFDGSHQSKPKFDQDLQSCTTCHRSPARPNWEAYDVWEGAYGQVEDQIKKGSEEDQAFHRFLANRNTGRYQFLVGSAELKTKSIEEVSGALPTGQTPTAYSIDTLPNFRLTFFLNRLNYQRIAKLIEATPHFSTFKYAYYAALFGCGPIQEYLPTEVTAQFQQSYDQIFQDTIQKITAQFATRSQKDGPFDSFKIFNGETGPSNFEATSASRYIIAKLRYLTDNRGVSTADWSLAPTPDAYIFSDGELYLKEIARNFESDLSQIQGLVVDYVNLEEASTSDLFGARSKDFEGQKRLTCCNYDPAAGNPSTVSNGTVLGGNTPSNCSILRKLSLDAFQASGLGSGAGSTVAVGGDANPSHLRQPRELVTTCSACHGSIGNSTGLTFSDFDSLQAQLSKPGFAHGTLLDELQSRLKSQGPGMMPPFPGIMSDAERASVADALSAPVGI